MSFRAALRPILVLLVLIGSSPAFADLLSFEKSTIAIATAKAKLPFQVELATTEAQREQGLMYRPAMAPDAGMLFVYPSARSVSFWMKNTIIPLDMLFIGSDGRIVDIHERAVPYSEAVITAGAAAQYVLEVNGGTVDRLGIAVGDQVTGAALGK